MSRPQLNDQQILQALGLLGISPMEFQNVRRSTSVEEANKKLDDLRDRAKKAFRQQAVKLHPDVNGGDPVKTEQFKLLNTFLAEIANLKVVARPMPMPRPMPMHPMYASTSSTTTGGGIPTTTVIFGVRMRVQFG